MSTEDLPFAIQTTDQMKWGLMEDDFEFIMELEPEGCFVAIDNNKRIGLATTISYGNVGWFGNLIVDKAYRNKGAGSKLVKHSIEYLIRKNVKTVGLYAYESKIHFYSRLSFRYDSDFIVMKGKGFPSNLSPNVRRAQKIDMAEIVECDESCFGSSRRKLLEPILSDQDNLCYTVNENGHIVAYAVAKVYRGVAELGPLVSRPGRNDLAVDLLKTILHKLNGVEVSLYLPTRETATINMLKDKGFAKEFKVARMFHGPPMFKSCVQTAESLERG